MNVQLNQRFLVTMAASLALAVSSLLIGGSAQAAMITGLLMDDYSTSYAGGGRQPSKTYNGTATEDSTTATDNWMTNSPDTSVSITWFLNGQYNLDSIKVFNYREVATVARSAKDVVLSVSNDYGKTFTVVPSNGGTIPGTLTQAPTSGPNTPTTFTLGGGPVTNVKLAISNSYGDPYVGLNEVEFFGTATHSFTQVPITVTAKSSEYTPAGVLATNTVNGVFETMSIADMWMSDGSDNLPTITYSLGATPQRLDHLNIWNFNVNTFAYRGLDDIQIQLFDASMVSLGLAVDDADGDTTFTLNKNNGKSFANATPSLDGNSVMDALGIRNAPAASFFKIITLTNPDGAGFGGLTEVQAFVVVPEPASVGALAVGAAACALSRRNRRERTV